MALWAPVALGLGSALYFGLPREPALWFLSLLAVGAVTSAAVIRRRGVSQLFGAMAILIALFACGMLLAKVRTVRVTAPIAPVTKMVKVEGWVVDVTSPGPTGGRLIIAPTWIEGVTEDDTPLRIRMTFRDNVLATPGSAITFKGLINPPPPPAAPQAYDFARNAWFDGVGGVGVALTAISPAELTKPPWRLRWQMGVNAMRWRLAQRIAGDMSEKSRGLGAAMITGHEAWIDKENETELRDAGLAHIISISGVHMAIVGGFVFLLVRLTIAAMPWLALRVPGKKVAALVALLAVGTYLVVSGAPAPAQRAAITAAVAFGAILVDRRAISLRALAIAALLVLLRQPEAVVEPGFQMSFAATAALVALAEVMPPRIREINTPWPIRLIQGAVYWLCVSLMVSFVAGAATGPFAMQHFNRVAMFGLPANLITEPLSTFLIMPFLALGGVLEPLGLGRPFLTVAGWGIELLNGMAHWVSSSPHSVVTVASAPAIALPIAFVGVLWLCLWKGRLRWLGLPAALAVLIWPRPDPPMAWIGADGGAVGLRNGRAAVLMRPDVKLFGAQLWAGRRGLTIGEDPKVDRDRTFVCTGVSCRAINTKGLRISAWWTIRHPKAGDAAALCRASDILIMKADIETPAECMGVLILRPADFAKGGAVEIYPDGAKWRLVWAQPFRGVRPWTTPGGEER
ncbi:ComEC/Rec2 family competence protein [soil metagenome]